MFDYGVLLKKYMAMVWAEYGSTYVSEWSVMRSTFSDVEWAVLEEASREVKSEYRE